MRRGLVVAVAGCLVSGLAILWAGGNDWARVATTGQRLSAEDLVGAPAPWGWVARAGGVAVLASRGWGRIPVGAALMVAGGGTAWLATEAIRDTDTLAYEATGTGGVIAPIAYPVAETPWVWITLVASLLLLATGVYTCVRGPSWPALGGRYDAPQRRDDPWAALDRGEDPTA